MEPGDRISILTSQDQLIEDLEIAVAEPALQPPERQIAQLQIH